ncbi:hypothetical protein CAJAP_09454 [Camponotus japonicus]
MTINALHGDFRHCASYRWIGNIAKHGPDCFIASGAQAAHVMDTPNVYRMGIAPCSKYYKSDLLRAETVDAAKRPYMGRPT